MQKDAYTLILESIETGVYKPGDRLVESEMAERLGVSRTPVREALQRLETQGMLARDGRSLIVASLDHNQLAEIFAEVKRLPERPQWLSSDGRPLSTRPPVDVPLRREVALVAEQADEQAESPRARRAPPRPSQS